MSPKIHAVGQRQTDASRARVVAIARRSLDPHGKNGRVDDPGRVRGPPLHVLRRQLVLPVRPERRRRAPSVGAQRNADDVRCRGGVWHRCRFAHAFRSRGRWHDDATKQSAGDASRPKGEEAVHRQFRRLSAAAEPLAAIVATPVAAASAGGAGVVRRAAHIPTSAFRLTVESARIVDRPSAGARGPLNQRRCRPAELLNKKRQVRFGGSLAFSVLGRGRSDCQTDRKRQQHEYTTDEHRNCPPIERLIVPHSTCSRKDVDTQGPSRSWPADGRTSTPVRP